MIKMKMHTELGETNDARDDADPGRFSRYRRVEINERSRRGRLDGPGSLRTKLHRRSSLRLRGGNHAASLAKTTWQIAQSRPLTRPCERALTTKAAACDWRTDR